MKKIITLLMACLICVSLTACGEGVEINKKDEEYINEAVSCVTKAWKEEYVKYGLPTVVKIKNARISWLEENDCEGLEGVECVVDFDIHSNWMSENEDYLCNFGMKNSVVFYEDGSCETVSRSPIEMVRLKTYSTEHYDYIEESTDYDDYFNCELDFTK